jgi:site-specific DNA-cytosine methylase
MRNQLRSIDLFSGIGGFAYALHNIVATVAYCEIDPICRDVLQKNIDKGNIDKAPIFTDVTKLDYTAIKKLKPNMLCGGFPCQDISAANPQGAGLSGERSGLFLSILELLDNVKSIDVVFLENSPLIIKKGFSFIKKQMMARGFIVKYCLASARDVGAHHVRSRWYCLCFKPTRKLENLQISPRNINFGWSAKASAKIQPVVQMETTRSKLSKALMKRCSMLGNSIVPQSAMHAWNFLINPLNSQINVHQFKKPPKMNIICDDGDTQITCSHFATPCKSCWYICSMISDRGTRVICNQLFYDRNTIINGNKKEIYKSYTSNPIFVEYLMGYPKNWTR